MCNAASPLIAEWLGHSGYDFVVVDLQHGENNLDNVSDDAAGAELDARDAGRARAGQRADVHPARAGPRRLRRDRAAGGHARGCAKPSCASVRYAPKGNRSWGRCAARSTAGRTTSRTRPSEMLTLVMLESAKALANAREILAVDGVDGCFVGPADLEHLARSFAGHAAEAAPRRRRRHRAIAAAAQGDRQDRGHALPSASTTRASASRRAIAS